MRNFLPALLVATCLTAACAPLAALSTEGGQSSTSLGPDGVATTESTSTLASRVAAGLSWLWSSYVALKAKGLDVSALREAISEIQDVVSKGDLTAAINLWSKARVIVTEITQ